MVDGPDAELTDDTAHSMSEGVFMHVTSHVLDDVAGVTVVGSERVSAVDEEATANPSKAMYNNDLRTELEYFSEDSGEEIKMEPRPRPARAVTPPLRAVSPVVCRRRERVVRIEETQNRGESRVKRNREGRRPSEEAPRGNGSQNVNLPPLLAAHTGKSKNGKPLQSSLTSVYRGQALSNNVRGNLPPNAHGLPSANSNRKPLYRGKLRQRPTRKARTIDLYKREVYAVKNTVSKTMAYKEGITFPPVTRVSNAPVIIEVASDSPHNMLLGRTAMQKIGIMVSTIHGAIKFHTKKGVKTILSVGEAGEETKKRTLTISKERIPSCDDTEEKIIVNDKCLKQMNTRSLCLDRNASAYKVAKELTKAGILKKVKHQMWVANPVMVKKNNGGWRMCFDFTDINKTCPKDCYPLPKIDWKIESLAEFCLKCSLDAYNGYHQIQMAEGDEDKTTLFVGERIFCYGKMPLGLENAGNEHYALWEVIEFGDSYKAPQEEAASESFSKKKGRTVVITTEDIQKKRNDVKARTTLLLALLDEHQLQAIVSHLEFMNVEIEQDDLNQKFLTSLALEWLMYTIMWRNRDDHDTISLDDVYNHLKVYEPEVQKKTESNSHNMAFISSANTSSRKGKVHTASVPIASTQVSTASADVAVASISHDTVCVHIASQSNGSHIKYEDITQIDKDDIEEIDIKAPRSQDRGRRESYKQGTMEEEPALKALMAIDGIRWDWCYIANEEEDQALVADDEAPTKFALMAKSSSSFENEVKKEKEGLDNKLIGFESALKDLDTLLGS
nr:hypothetical protein [Tanacetum cinerariifolium]